MYVKYIYTLDINKVHATIPYIYIFFCFVPLTLILQLAVSHGLIYVIHLLYEVDLE
jgi:hypothetical protein